MSLSLCNLKRKKNYFCKIVMFSLNLVLNYANTVHRHSVDTRAHFFPRAEGGTVKVTAPAKACIILGVALRPLPSNLL